MKKYEAPEISIVEVFATDIVAATYIQRSAERLGGGGKGGGGGGIGVSSGDNTGTWISGWAGQTTSAMQGGK